MTLALGTPEEKSQKDTLYQANDVVSKGFYGYSSLAPGANGTLGTFVADQNYALVAVDITAQQANNSGARLEQAVLAWCKNEATVFTTPGSSTPILLTLAGVVASVMTCVTANPHNVTMFKKFDPYTVYLPKGSSLFLRAANVGAVDDQALYFVTNLFLMPTFV